MKRFLACSLLFATVLAFAGTKWTTYTNARFGFSVQLPSDLRGGPEPANGDGLTFTGGGVTVRAYGGNKMGTLDEEFKQRLEFLKKDGQVTYRHKGADFFVISGKVGKSDFYQRTVEGKDAFATVDIQYPSADRKAFRSKLVHVTKSLKFSAG